MELIFVYKWIVYKCYDKKIRKCFESLDEINEFLVWELGKNGFLRILRDGKS